MARPKTSEALDLAQRCDLTAGAIDRLTCPPGKMQAFLRDSESPGLRVRVTAAGAKSYVFEGKLGDVPLAVEPSPVTAPGWTCYAAFRTAPLSVSERRASRAFRRVRIWPQPRSLRMRVAASLSALATQRSTI